MKNTLPRRLAEALERLRPGPRLSPRLADVPADRVERPDLRLLRRRGRGREAEPRGRRGHGEREGACSYSSSYQVL